MTLDEAIELIELNYYASTSEGIQYSELAGWLNDFKELRKFARSLDAEELHINMLKYANKVSKDKDSALRFLKRIGAPV